MSNPTNYAIYLFAKENMRISTDDFSYKIGWINLKDINPPILSSNSTNVSSDILTIKNYLKNGYTVKFDFNYTMDSNESPEIKFSTPHPNGNFAKYFENTDNSIISLQFQQQPNPTVTTRIDYTITNISIKDSSGNEVTEFYLFFADTEFIHKVNNNAEKLQCISEPAPWVENKELYLPDNIYTGDPKIDFSTDNKIIYIEGTQSENTANSKAILTYTENPTTINIITNSPPRSGFRYSIGGVLLKNDTPNILRKISSITSIFINNFQTFNYYLEFYANSLSYEISYTLTEPLAPGIELISVSIISSNSKTVKFMITQRVSPIIIDIYNDEKYENTKILITLIVKISNSSKLPSDYISNTANLIVHYANDKVPDESVDSNTCNIKILKCNRGLNLFK
ncbi:hypothetical protein [Clostridium sp. D53t1_180928_C8]|uniref:hypothetical protein n=1 Tax=Clostridium sp. D53t1_180928_C8 TaxID=2787101 RepID=UPI0018A8FED1|nr:hypothetical protein [Clostridium sp. D53t1_180928_C8]